MAEKITEKLFRLDIPLVGNPLKNLNSYLVNCGERFLLIDTGFCEEPCREAMNRQLDELGVDRSRLDIYMTHLHSDHTGLAPELVRPGGRLLIGERDGNHLKRSMTASYWERRYAFFGREGFSSEELKELRKFNPAQNSAPKAWDGPVTYLQDGSVLEYGDYRFRCILTPGHTPGHMCLYEENRKWLFSGDHVLFHITPNICRWEDREDSLGDYLQSLERICELPVELLLPAHRAETGDLKTRISELKAHHAVRIENCRKIVEQEPNLNAYEIAGRMQWSIRSRNWAEFPLTQKFFAVGEAMAHLDYLIARGILTSEEVDGTVRYRAVSVDG